MCPSEATNALGVKPKIYLFSTSSHPDAISVNSLDITFLKPQIDFSSYDYFILTSKQAVESLKQYDDLLLKPALCISEQTAKAYEKIGGSILNIGSGYGDTLMEKIQSYSKNTKWIYLRAKIVASKFVEELNKDSYNIKEIITYESKCSKEIECIEVENDATLIFTSPSSVKCFLAHNTISPNSKLIVIGDTTASALPQNLAYTVSNEKTVEACFELV